jgi:predicted metalloprotease with PDZ domain
VLLAALPILFSGAGWAAGAPRNISLTADLSDAPRKMFHARLTVPVEPGPAAFYYPQWIPGEHAPSGPVDNLTGIEFTANGRRLPWKRDDVNMFLIRVTVPPGASELLAKVDFLATAAPSGFSAGASTSVNLAVLNWNQVLLYPAGRPVAEITFEPSVNLPEGWALGTALKVASHEGATTRFEPVALNMLIDSPVLAGRFFKEVALAPEITPKHFLDMAADNPEELSISDREVNRFSDLVRETGALFQSRHYDQYHFLLTLSDQVAHFGLEHHQSSDDRLEAHSLTDDDLLLLDADLLPHEFTHSWNGKFRRPAGLVTEDYQHPMKTELLWVYEGLTQYLGDVLAARCGLWNPEQYRAYLASSAAEYDHRPGRTWRDLQDTATAAQTIYDTPDAWDNWRRGTDFYSEGELLWLEVDTTIRQLSKGKHSLNDFCARFYGIGGNTGPKTIPYGPEDLVTALNEIQVNDWSRFFEERLTSLSPHAPLDGITKGGYILEYNDQPNDYLRAADSRDGGVSAWYSLGFDTKSDNTISDVLVGSLAYQAGLGPGMKLIAINGRRASADILRAAIRESKQHKESLELIVDNDDYVKVLKLDYHGGEKYPHLVRNAKERNSLDEIIKPLTRHAAATGLE